MRLKTHTQLHWAVHSIHTLLPAARTHTCSACCITPQQPGEARDALQPPSGQAVARVRTRQGHSAAAFAAKIAGGHVHWGGV
jgi:hypothetical protein